MFLPNKLHAELLTSKLVAEGSEEVRMGQAHPPPPPSMHSTSTNQTSEEREMIKLIKLPVSLSLHPGWGETPVGEDRQ